MFTNKLTIKICDFPSNHIFQYFSHTFFIVSVHTYEKKIFLYKSQASEGEFGKSVFFSSKTFAVWENHYLKNIAWNLVFASTFTRIVFISSTFFWQLKVYDYKILLYSILCAIHVRVWYCTLLISSNFHSYTTQGRRYCGCSGWNWTHGFRWKLLLYISLNYNI